MSQIILNGLTTEQLKELLVEVIAEHLSSASSVLSAAHSSQDQPTYLTRAEAAKLLQISLPTLNDYTKRGVISSYRIGANVRYKFSDIESALQERNFTTKRKGGRHGA
ncbi:excisionase family DNA binding protein [Pontibacter ummariensis]|uniref:DNA binding domain-containing protein, excisionase family n=1 Tax=Pontibacter ummariensis TaxID=1610492 RepID=A0A239J5F5_9BACT|nr:helix-turn-helix domain-containing protein [Pontibacter ummariensis]PRY08868.1 excisionase family DNA binding protein [Pontibacter ummariensis]SNT00483.1 DNA binding domain-containing protein, excisionase family [Pontibacter ummariensis]